MKKFSVILGVLALFIFVASPNAPVKAKACNIHNNNHDKITNNYDNSVTNQGGKGGAGGNATIERGAITNFNTNLNNNNNSNKNTNVNKQAQGQIQGQKQSQSQSNNANNSNTNDQSVTINQEGTTMVVEGSKDVTQYEAKRDHIRGPEIVTPDAKLSGGKPFSIKVHGTALLSNIEWLTKAQAKKLSSKSNDVTCEPALVLDNDFSTDKVKCSYGTKKAPGEFMGYLYMGSDGPDVNAAAMIGAAAAKAMEAGATHIRLVETEIGEMSEGSSWNIGIGGGASIMASGDSTAVAPNGGLGFGKAKAFNELRPEMIFELTFDRSYVSKYILSKHDTSYSAVEGN